MHTADTARDPFTLLALALLFTGLMTGAMVGLLGAMQFGPGVCSASVRPMPPLDSRGVSEIIILDQLRRAEPAARV